MQNLLSYRVASSPGKSWKVLESPGIGFSPGKASWKIGKLYKSPGKVLEKIICLKLYFSFVWYTV